MNFHDVCLAIVSVLSSFAIICAVICLGWYIVWIVFLSRFKLVRELLGLINDNPAASNEQNGPVRSRPSVATAARSRRSRRD